MSSPEHRLSAEARTTLHEVALASIEYGLDHGCAPDLDLSLFCEELRAPSATFVTLHRTGRLRGCMGTLKVSRPLVDDISLNAWRSANTDPRFPPVIREEFDDLEVPLSVLSPLFPFPVSSHAELLRELRPAIAQDELLHKAELGRNHWSDTIEFQRNSVEEI